LGYLQFFFNIWKIETECISSWEKTFISQNPNKKLIIRIIGGSDNILSKINNLYLGFFIVTLALMNGCLETPQQADVVLTTTTMPEVLEKTPSTLAKVEIVLTEFPSNVKDGETIKIRWRVVGEGLTASHSAIHYDGDSRSGDFGTTTDISDAGYDFVTTEYAVGNYLLPMEFTTVLTILPDASEVVYFRGHTTVEGKNYWTDEKTITIEKSVGGS
jgi:hypothetical protein